MKLFFTSLAKEILCKYKVMFSQCVEHMSEAATGGAL